MTHWYSWSWLIPASLQTSFTLLKSLVHGRSLDPSGKCLASFHSLFSVFGRENVFIVSESQVTDFILVVPVYFQVPCQVVLQFVVKHSDLSDGKIVFVLWVFNISDQDHESLVLLSVVDNLDFVCTTISLELKDARSLPRSNSLSVRVLACWCTGLSLNPSVRHISESGNVRVLRVRHFFVPESELGALEGPHLRPERSTIYLLEAYEL